MVLSTRQHAPVYNQAVSTLDGASPHQDETAPTLAALAAPRGGRSVPRDGPSELTCTNCSPLRTIGACRGRTAAGTRSRVASDPPGSGVAAFAWRVSVADIERDGPFSAFPGRGPDAGAARGERHAADRRRRAARTAHGVRAGGLRGRGRPALRAHRRTDARLQPDGTARRGLGRRRRRPRRGLRDRAGARVRLLRRRGRVRVPDRRLSAVRRRARAHAGRPRAVGLRRFRASTCIRHRARRWRSWP